MQVLKNNLPQFLFSLKWLCLLIVLMAQVVTWFSTKDDSSDAWAYHVYSGLSLLDHRVEQDYFPASTQSYFNPLVHVPFAAMVKAEWPDRLVAGVMALYSSMALVLLAVFFRRSLGLERWYLVGALLLSLSGLVIWVGVGSSVPDLFLQIPVFAALILFFPPPDSRFRHGFILSGFFLGCALGLKLSAIIYIPAFAVIFLGRLVMRRVKLVDVFSFASGGVLGFFLLYGWWGVVLYQKFGNPFFPFFNEWFKSPEFDQVVIVNHRFLSESLIEQLLLPFRTALSDVLVYMEMRMPDLRAGVFVLSMLVLLSCSVFRKKHMNLGCRESEFLVFLVILLYTWALMSGNGRYGIGIFCFFGAGILIALRAALPLKVFRSVFLLVILLQGIVLVQAFKLSDAPFRFRDTKWGGTWFNVEFSDAVGAGNQLILSGTRNSYSVFVKDVGENTSVINVHGLFALDLTPVIERYLDRYRGNTIGMVLASPVLQGDPLMLDRVYFDEFGRFGLRVGDTRACHYVEKKEGDGSVKGGFLFCPLISDPQMIRKYNEKVADAKRYFKKLEKLCPDVFSPTIYAVSLFGGIKEKYYGNYEVEVLINSAGQVMAKKEWSMAILPLGAEDEMDSINPVEWHKKYCDPIRYVRAMSSKEKIFQ